MAERRRIRDERLSYLNPGSDAVWTQDPDNALYRLESRMSARVKPTIDTVIERRSVDGGWEVVDTNDPVLTGVQRGYFWTGWLSAIEGDPIVCYEGVRVIDAQMAASFFDGLVVRDHDGNELASAEAAGLRFALRVEEARVFAHRVQAAGGRVRRVEPRLDEITRHVAAIERSASQLGLIAAQSQAIVAAGARGVTLDLHKIGDLTEGAWAARGSALRAMASLGPALDALTERGRSVAERVLAARQRETAQEHMRQVEARYEFFRNLEEQAVIMMAATGSPETTGHLDPDADAALAQIAAQITAAGQRCRLDAGLLRVETPDGVIEIGRRVRVSRARSLPPARSSA